MIGATSCGEGAEATSKKVELVDFDLSEHGIPAVVTAPSDAVVKSKLSEQEAVDFEMESYTVTSGNYCLSMIVTDVREGKTVADLVADSKIYISDDVKVVEEIDNGFITLDEYGSHDFFWAAENDGKFLEFSAGISKSNLSLEDIHVMLKSIKL